MEDPLPPHPEWEAAPPLLKELVLLLERQVPEALQSRFHDLRDLSPAFHAATVSIIIVILFFGLYGAVHVHLYKCLASHYPILGVLFRGKGATSLSEGTKDTIKPESKDKPLNSRGRSKGTTKTQYRGSKFGGPRHVKTPKVVRPTPLPATSTGDGITAPTSQANTVTACGSGDRTLLPTPGDR